MFVSRTIFLEKRVLREGANACKIKLGEVQEVEGLTHIGLDLIEESNSKPIEALLRRFNRVPHPSDNYFGI